MCADICDRERLHSLRRIRSDEHPLAADVPEADVGEDRAERHDCGSQLRRSDVMDLDPLLKDAVRLQAIARQRVELSAVEIRRAGEPHAGELQRDQIVATIVEQKEVASILEMKMRAMVVQHATIEVLE